MTTEATELSRTDRNLWSAIAAEGMAQLKYNAYAHKALEEGHPEVAQVFQEVAGAENIHGMNHLRVAGHISSTAANLREVVTGEVKEFATVYPRMIREALSEGREDAADSFALALERERHHQTVFSEALGRLEEKEARAAQTAAERRERDPAGPTSRAEMMPFPASSGASSLDSPLAARLPAGYDGEEMDLQTYVDATQEVDRERFRVANLGRLREVVFGAQDGILSTVALVTSVAVAVGSTSTVLVAGLAAALAGMVSMATGAYLGSRAEQDVQRAEIEKEARELEENPAEEYAELMVIFQREGKSFEEARQLSDRISEDKDLWLSTMVEKELGFSLEDTSSPIKDALVMGAAFIIAAAIPIVPYMVWNGGMAIGVSITAGLAALFALGMAKGRIVRRSPLKQGLEILGIGVASAGVGFLLGEGIPRLIG